MDPSEFRTSWHADSWKELSKQFPRRIVLYAGLGFLLLWRVLTPFTSLEAQRSGIQERVQANERGLDDITRESATLDGTRRELSVTESKLEGFAEQAYRDLRKRAVDIGNKHRVLVSQGREEILRSVQGRRVGQVPDRMAAAAKFIDLTGDKLRPVADRASLRRLIDKLTTEKFHALIVEGVDAMVARLQKSVLGPLRKSLASTGLSDSVLDDDMARLDKTVATWKKKRIKDLRWADTIHGKAEALMAFRNSVRAELRRMQRKVSAKKTRVDERKAALETRKKQIEKDQATLEQEATVLEGRMRTLLPGWLREYLSVDETFVFFPFLLLLATLHLVFKAASMLVHYRALRRAWSSGNADAVPPSTWTLAWRGGARVPATLIAYGVVVAVLWYLFEWSMHLAVNWKGGGEVAGVRGWLPATGVLGRVLFVAMILGVMTALLGDRRQLRAGAA